MGRYTGEPAAGLKVSIQQRLRRIDGLDLEPIAYKLVHGTPDAAGLDLAAVETDISLYRCFLKVCALYPSVPVVPSTAIDEVWHTHLLDTAKYRADCAMVFGYFLDHFPYAGLRGEQDRAAWRADFARTRQLFMKHFGVDVGAEAAASACRNHGDGAECLVGSVTRPADSVRPVLSRRRVPAGGSAPVGGVDASAAGDCDQRPVCRTGP